MLLVLGVLALATIAAGCGGASSAEIDEATALARTAESPAWLDAARGVSALLAQASRVCLLCRRAELRKISRYQRSMRTLGSRIETAGPTWEAVLTFEAGLTSAIRSFEDDVRPCLAAAPANVQETIDLVLNGG